MLVMALQAMKTDRFPDLLYPHLNSPLLGSVIIVKSKYDGPPASPYLPACYFGAGIKGSSWTVGGRGGLVSGTPSTIVGFLIHIFTLALSQRLAMVMAPHFTEGFHI